MCMYIAIVYSHVCACICVASVYVCVYMFVDVCSWCVCLRAQIYRHAL